MSFPKKTKNPNPSPIEKRFGFSWFGAPRKTRTHWCSGFSFCLHDGRARTGRRRTAPQAISPVGCCLARGSQRLGMSNVEAVKSKDFMAFLFFWQSLHTFAHLLHTLQKSHELFASLAQRVFRCTKREFYAKSTRVSSRRSSASICRMASRIILPVIFVATGVLFSGGSCGFAPATSCV